jgi:hemerythrin-like metal-binding protein
MALFVWNADISVGNAFIDGDHKKLVTMINSFHDAMEQGRGREVIGKVLHNLVIYTKEHFGREEAEMQRINYPKYLAHKLEHDKLIREVLDLQSGFLNGNTMLTVTISRFLRDWLLVHIKQTDQLLAAALR